MEEVTDVVLAAINAISRNDQQIVHELEGRLGTRESDGSFCPGVDMDWFEALILRLEANTVWASQTGWVESEDTTFYAEGDRLRQSRRCDPETCLIELETVRKIGVRSSCIALQTSSAMTSAGANTIRIAYSSEQIINTQLPMLVLPTYVRIKQRRVFVLDSTAFPNASWRFELTRTWAGTTREEAEHEQNSAPPVCEVEIEWDPPSASIIPSPACAVSVFVAESMIAKLTALVT